MMSSEGTGVSSYFKYNVRLKVEVGGVVEKVPR